MSETRGLGLREIFAAGILLITDVFYTNSRYAKVGGLPPHELNQLELQFLLLNNFTLMIPPEEMQRYGDRLLAYWQGREESGSEAPTGDEREGSRRTESNNNVTTSAPAPAAPTPAPGPAPPPAGEHTRSDKMDVDERPKAQRQSSSTAPGTPTPAVATPSTSASQLQRSASVPRRPTGELPMRPTVNFAPVQRDNVVGVGL